MKLIDVCEFIVDCPHSTAADEGEGYPLIRTPNIGKGHFLLDGVHRVSESVYNKRNARAVPQNNDLIFAREAPAGNVAIIKNDVKMCLGQRTVLIRPNKEKVNPDFLNYFLLAPQQQYGLLGTANGSTVAHVNLPTIRDLEIDLPPMQTQKRIADILSAYDILIENNQKQIKLLEEAAQRLYKEWFVDLRFPGHENVKIVDGVPEGWTLDVFADVAVFKRGKAITKTQTNAGNVPVVAGGLEPAYYHSVANTESPVITVSASGANAGFARMYHTKIWASDCSYIDSAGTKNLEWVYGFLKENKANIEAMQKGAAQPHVYASDLNRMEAMIPDNRLLELFRTIVGPIYAKIGKLEEQIKYLSEARERSLPKLMNGEMER